MGRLEEILKRKTDSQEVSDDDVEYLVKSLQQGKLQGAQIGSFLVACHLNGISRNELRCYTRCLLGSAGRMAWPSAWRDALIGVVSIGDVSDVTPLVLTPALAACGLKVPYLVPRGKQCLANPVEKLKVVGGFSGQVELTRIHKILKKAGCCFANQLETMAPAERLLYNNLQITGASCNRPLLAACMMARAAALNTNKVVVLLHSGGATHLSPTEADELADLLAVAAKSVGVQARILQLRRDKPLSHTIGNTIEVQEAMDCLCDDGPEELVNLICRIGGHVLVEMGKEDTVQSGMDRTREVLADGTAKQKFVDMLVAQGVSRSDTKSMFKHRQEEDSPTLAGAMYRTHLSAEVDGHVGALDMVTCANILSELVKGRPLNTETVGTVLGLHILIPVGTKVEKGDLWGKLYHDMRLTDKQVQRLRTAVHISEDPPSTQLMQFSLVS